MVQGGSREGTWLRAEGFILITKQFRTDLFLLRECLLHGRPALFRRDQEVDPTLLNVQRLRVFGNFL